jgi:hypothetical protein
VLLSVEEHLLSLNVAFTSALGYQFFQLCPSRLVGPVFKGRLRSVELVLDVKINQIFDQPGSVFVKRDLCLPFSESALDLCKV